MEALQLAIHQMLCPSSPENQRAASQWLTQWRETADAWPQATTLLLSSVCCTRLRAWLVAAALTAGANACARAWYRR